MAPPKKLKTPPGTTLSGKPPRLRLTRDIPGVGKRDDYLYRAEYEAKTGKKLPTNTVLDHANESLASKKDPNAKVAPVSRSANSRSGGGLRHHLEKKKGKK
jgi:hypothetical protein